MPHPRWLSSSQRPDQRGAVAIEGALVLSMILIPLLMGVIAFGQTFYKAQPVDLVTPPMVQTDQDGNPFWEPSGNCETLANRIKQSMIDTLVKANQDLFGGNSQVLEHLTVNVTSIPDTNAVYVNAGLQPVLTEWLASRSNDTGYKNWASDWSGMVRNAWVAVPGGAGSCRA